MDRASDKLIRITDKEKSRTDPLHPARKRREACILLVLASASYLSWLTHSFAVRDLINSVRKVLGRR
jgi:hypothetical protein